MKLKEVRINFHNGDYYDTKLGCPEKAAVSIIEISTFEWGSFYCIEEKYDDRDILVQKYPSRDISTISELFEQEED